MRKPDSHQYLEGLTTVDMTKMKMYGRTHTMKHLAVPQVLLFAGLLLTWLVVKVMKEVKSHFALHLW